jgi:CheY-like chemotaxis protein
MRPENILFVDDNELLRSVMERFFAKEFQHIMSVGTGTEAMMHIRETFYHVVILDKKLPDIDGLDILAFIREKSPKSKVIMITSNGDASVMQQALEGGAFGFFEKPFDIKKLKAALRCNRVHKPLPARIAEKYDGMSHNLSDSGILIMTDAVFSCGTAVDLLLKTSDKCEIPLKGTVMRTCDSSCVPPHPFGFTAKDTMKYGVGIQLVEPPPAYSSFVGSLTA